MLLQSGIGQRLYYYDNLINGVQIRVNIKEKQNVVVYCKNQLIGIADIIIPELKKISYVEILLKIKKCAWIQTHFLICNFEKQLFIYIRLFNIFSNKIYPLNI